MGISIKEGISIITIVLNGKDLIEETILSVLNQKFNPLEYIIIDGGSTDGTLEIIEKYKSHIYKVITGKDGGIYQAINKGIALCNHSLIGIIHCGDIYMPGTLLKVQNNYKEIDADVYYGDIEIMEEKGNEYILRYEIADHSLLKKGMSIFHPSTFIKLSTYKKYGLYNCHYRSASDYDFFLGLFLQGYKFEHIPAILSRFRSDGISSKNFKLNLKENYQIRKKQLSVKNAIIYKLSTIIIHLFLKYRRMLLISIVGRNKYFKLKKAKYNN